ncbi:UDP-2,3-diacylglucosamine diphosphatase [Enterobacillus tribolii]|uniref:UDP-2,3-diacylglucosamine hydrolase n=1 Tax=Enterobacillus tribolii TaxID=1487935 RepID=A0A370QPY2_9GAMM|nr:UDP-2,3-diacylglucosamine diphosphatase [Enterobacillus tribolii]MBW7981920.1 UDP-2,3-diacylglucosamine diphosphatase [Enterobacillus tribolii]RDK90060.1 UDP-2,3-diacylglucosamine hydrolase [Enterobacillus tribolii]
MATLFIADLHLSAQEPAITAGFLHFLQQEETRGADALYILGDFFEYWIGDDDPDPLHQQIADALKALADHDVPCFFIHGNRDFLLGKRFAARCGMTLLPQEQVLTLYGHKVLILHGDTLCSDDTEYQRYRRRVHNPLIQRIFLWLPLKLRLKIADNMRRRSQSGNAGKDESIMDVTPKTVEAEMMKHRVRWMIHGHTHRPAIHHFPLPDGETGHRAVLGAWHSEGSMIRVTKDAVELVRFPF